MFNFKRNRAIPGVAAIALSAVSFTHAADPIDQRDESMITLSGTVIEVGQETFELDYGGGKITVGLEDWDKTGESMGLSRGIEVTVFGEVDDNFLSSTIIEADALYLKALASYHYAGSSEPGTPIFDAFLWSEPDHYELSDMTVRGEVVSVDKDERAFTLAAGRGSELLIETATLNYNPLETGVRDAIDVGDWVRVSGRLDYQFFEGKVIKAEAITTLYEDIDPA